MGLTPDKVWRDARAALLWTGALILLWCGVARAGAITMEISAVCQRSPHGLTAIVTVTNSGDEAAFELRARVSRAGASAWSDRRPELAPGRSWTTRAALPGAPTLPGSYALPVTLVFHDQNGRRFNALSHALFVQGPQKAPALNITARRIDLRDSGRLVFTLTNQYQQPVRVHVRVAAPAEISTEPKQWTVEPGPGRTVDMAVQVRNLSARHGASYPILALAEYVHDRTHHAVTAGGRVSIVTRRPFFRQYRAVFIGLSGVLLLIATLLQISPSREKRAP